MGLKPITITESQWHKLESRLREDHPPSWTMIRTVMKDRLGFTVRIHTEYRDTRRLAGEFGMPEYGSRREPYRVICLDFYDEAKRTMFVLKYSDYLRQ